MVLRPAEPVEVHNPAAKRQRQSQTTRIADRESDLARSALAFAVRCHTGERESDGAQFIEHPVQVARLLRDSGCSGVLVAAGLLHHLLDDAHSSIAELKSRFGADVANLVQAVSDDTSCGSYRQRKHAQRERVGLAGTDAALLFAADKIAELRHLPKQVKREHARFASTPRQTRARNRMEHYHDARLEHYHESLKMLQRVAPRHPLVKRLASELHHCTTILRRENTRDHASGATS